MSLVRDVGVEAVAEAQEEVGLEPGAQEGLELEAELIGVVPWVALAAQDRAFEAQGDRQARGQPAAPADAGAEAEVVALGLEAGGAHAFEAGEEVREVVEVPASLDHQARAQGPVPAEAGGMFGVWQFLLP